MTTGFMGSVSVVDVHQLASVVRNRPQNVLLLDSRSFIEHNSCHISSAVNIGCSKIVKRRLQQDKISVKDLLLHTCHCEVEDKVDVVVYDQCSSDVESLQSESFTVILLKKLQLIFKCVNLLAGGFVEFQNFYPDLCEDKRKKCPPLTSLSQPCLPIANQGPTRILPFLYLGSQFDAMNKELLKDHNITYELNVSTSCPQPEFVSEGHFMRIPVNDTYNEKLLPHFPGAFNFLDKVREGSGCVLVHCLAGISRSPTVAIAYIMRYLHLSSDDGYRYVKSKRPTISPNFNFLGQLLEYEKQLRKENVLEIKPEITSASPIGSKKRLCRTDMRTTKLSLAINTKPTQSSNFFLQPKSGDHSPTTALAKLSFDGQVPDNAECESHPFVDFRKFRSKSCYGDWLRDKDETFVERKHKEINVTNSNKILSPVKEIKCDALISEISKNQIERASKSSVNTRQKVRSSFHAGDGRSSDSLSFQKQTNICSSDIGGRFCQSSSSSKVLKLSKSTEFSEKKFPPNPSKSENKFKLISKNETQSFHIYSNEHDKQISLTSINKSQGNNSSLHNKPTTLYPFSFTSSSPIRSDSVGTSGFGSESSDCLESFSEKKLGQCRLDMDLDELEDDVIYKSGEQISKTLHNHGAFNRSFFPLSLPDVTIRDWTLNVQSPLSPSESHLFDDLDIEKNISKTETSSPCESNFPSNDLLDSGVPASPPWNWQRKRGADFDAICLSSRSESPLRDKRRYKPFPALSPNSQRKFRTFLVEESSYLPVKQHTSVMGRNAYQFCDKTDKLGLYRVQSCPGILSHISSFCTHVDQSKKYSTQKYPDKDSYSYLDSHELMSHESCPDVHLSDLGNTLVMQPHRQKELRRNVRCIQVS